MGMLDGLLGQAFQTVDVKNLAAKVELSSEQVGSAVLVLGQARTALSDIVATAASATGPSAETLRQILANIGGEGLLATLPACWPVLGPRQGSQPVGSVPDRILPLVPI